VQRSDKKKEKVYRQYLRLEAHMKLYMFERNEKMDAGREKKSFDELANERIKDLPDTLD
jgi:hypothetical protein